MAMGLLLAVAGLQSPETALAQSAAQARPSTELRATELSAQQRVQRQPRRLRIYPHYNTDGVYPRYNPGPNAKRECTATYVQEYRPSGTVIVPRMNCWWRPG
jgi:hypothetical protein